MENSAFELFTVVSVVVETGQSLTFTKPKLSLWFHRITFFTFLIKRRNNDQTLNELVEVPKLFLPAIVCKWRIIDGGLKDC